MAEPIAYQTNRPPAAWLEVSLLVDGELAEAVAEVLSRYAPGGVAIESTAVTANEDDEGGRAVGPLRVCAYLPMNEEVEATRQRLEEALWYLGRICSLPAPQFQPVQEADWAEAWKKHYHPIPVGQKLIIVPAWLEPPSADRIPIRMDPGMAFGTGTHPTTQLCLEAIEDWFDARRLSSLEPICPPERVGHPERSEGSLPFPETELPSVIDVGCGSAILSIAALKLGAGRALGVDIDPQAIPVARHNAEINGVSDRLELGAGSVTAILDGSFSFRQAPLVLANILAPIIIRLLEDGLARLVTPGGALALSGILLAQWEGVDGHPSLREALARHGLHQSTIRQSGDWICVLVKA